MAVFFQSLYAVLTLLACAIAVKAAQDEKEELTWAKNMAEYIRNEQLPPIEEYKCRLF